MFRNLNVKKLSIGILSCYVVVLVYIQIQISFHGERGSRSRGATKEISIRTVTNANSVAVNGVVKDASDDDIVSNFSAMVANSTAGFATPFYGVLVYSAYLDKRQAKPKIRMVAIVDTWTPPAGWCHFWPPGFAKSDIPGGSKRNENFDFFNHKANLNFTTVMEFYETCEGHRKRYIAYIISCDVPREAGDKMDRVVMSKNPSWVVNKQGKFPTDDWFEIPVITINSRPSNEVSKQMTDNKKFPKVVKRRKFAVCVPPLFGSIPVDSMIEFIELTGILGADHFFFYSHEMHKSIKKLLGMYTKSSIATVLPWKHTFTGEDMWYYGQSAAIADCLFRTMGRFDWVAFNDIDEFMVPRDNFTESGTWEEFLTVYEKWNSTKFINLASLAFQSVVFDISSSATTNISAGNFLTMNTIQRTETISTLLTKQLVRPEKVFELGIHHLSKPMGHLYYSQRVKPRAGLLHHYRKCKQGYEIVCGYNTPDKTIQRYNVALRMRANSVLKHFHSES